jgi:hypothetical protein
VDRQQRIRFRSDAFSVPWLKDDEERVECRGLVGPEGGLLVAPPHLLKRHERTLARLSRMDLSAETTPHEAIDYARLSTTQWTISIFRERSRFSINLPEEPRKLGLLPGRGQLAAVFAAGTIMEIWCADKWLTYVREKAKNIDELQEAIAADTGDAQNEDE